MTLYTLPNSTGGLDQIVIDTMSTVDVGPFVGLTTLILAFVFFTVWIGGMARQKARVGFADAPMWATVAAIMMFVVSLIMTLTTGIISLAQLAVVITVTIFCGVWLFLDRRQSEV